MSYEMYLFAVFISVFFLFGRNYGTIVKDNYPQRIDVLEPLADHDVINIHSNVAPKNHEDSDWNLRYFPEKSHHSYHSIFADKNNMFSVDPTCDDAKTNVTIDLENFAINTVCFYKKFLPDDTISPILHEDKIPKIYEPPHICMEKSIEYTHPMISFGAHRPHWGQYGEYEFIPKQRWLHNLENGAVVMLYHPCAHPTIVNELRKLVTSCLRRHIITPYNLLSPERPMALYTWGKYLSMSVVDRLEVLKFIKQNARRGPEDIAEDGKYNHLLIKPANNTLSDEICSQFARD